MRGPTSNNDSNQGYNLYLRPAGWLINDLVGWLSGCVDGCSIEWMGGWLLDAITWHMVWHVDECENVEALRPLSLNLELRP